MKITIKDIARLANVSTATVSKILNNKDHDIGEATRQKVLDIVKEKDYMPNTIARGLVTNKTRTLALIIPDITNPFFPEIARGMEDKAKLHGYNVILCNTDGEIEKEEEYIRLLISRRVDGVIFTASTFSNANHLHLLKNAGIPFILVDRSVEGMEEVPKIMVDNEEGAHMAVRHLIDLKRKKIAFISGPLNTTTAQNRYKGYSRALKDFGRNLDTSLIKEGNYKVETGYEKTKELLEEHQNIDGIFTANDLIAIGALKAIKEKGLNVPRDISVVGFDNIYMAEFIEPSLTTINQPTYEIGRKACSLLLDIIQKKIDVETNVIIFPTLIKRESTEEKEV